MNKTVVLGLGNTLLRDDGVGVRVVEGLLDGYDFSPEVQILDGGTLGMDLLSYIETADHLLIIDALDVGAKPGTITRLEGDEIPTFLGVKMSPHQIGLADLLATARLCGCRPAKLVLWGVQPEVIDLGLELSSEVAAQTAVLTDQIVAELGQWGVEFTKKVKER